MRKILMELEKHELFYKWGYRMTMLLVLLVGWISFGMGWFNNIETKTNASAIYLTKYDATLNFLCKDEAKKEYVKLDVYNGSEKDRMLRFEIQQKQFDNISEAVDVPFSRRQLIKDLLRQLKNNADE